VHLACGQFDVGACGIHIAPITRVTVVLLIASKTPNELMGVMLCTIDVGFDACRPGFPVEGLHGGMSSHGKQLPTWLGRHARGVCVLPERNDVVLRQNTNLDARRILC
jgi:hypothetical protein